MENESIDARELAVRFVIKPDIPVPEKVVPYDPNQKPTHRKKNVDSGGKKKTRTKKKKQSFYENDFSDSFKIEDVKEELDMIKDEPISDEELENPDQVKCETQIESGDEDNYQIDDDDDDDEDEDGDEDGDDNVYQAVEAGGGGGKSKRN